MTTRQELKMEHQTELEGRQKATDQAVQIAGHQGIDCFCDVDRWSSTYLVCAVACSCLEL